MAIRTEVTADSGALRGARREAGLTQQELATRAGCSLSYLVMLEMGFSPARSAVLPRIIRVLNENGPAGYRAVPTTSDDGARNELYPE